jgi:hypothetical protein
VQQHERGGQDQPVHAQRQQPGRRAILTVDPAQAVDVRVRNHRHERGHGADHRRRREADHPVPGHRAAPRLVAEAAPLDAVRGRISAPSLKQQGSRGYAGHGARCPPAVTKDRPLADLDADVPFVRAALFYDGTRQPRPGVPVGLLFLLAAGVADLDRALIRELAVVVLVLVHAGSFQEPGGQCVSLSFAPWTVLAFPYNSLSWENSFGLRLPTTDWELTMYRPS